MSDKRRKPNAESIRRQRKKKKQKKIIISLITTILAIAFLVGAVYLTANLVSGDKPSEEISSSSSEEISKVNSVANSEDTPNNSEILNSESSSSQSMSSENSSSIEELTPSETTPPQTTNNKPEPGEFGTLVDVNNPLPSDFAPEVREIAGTGKLFDSRAADDLEQLLADAAAAGYPMYLVSTYRTIEYQEGLYQRKVNEYINLGYDETAAKAEAAKWVAIPGTSEHNLGLAADIVSSTWYQTNSDLTQDFENTEHFQWLYENSPKYGFFISFQKGKESITGIVYEPWHYRYVGVELATYLTENNLSLQEYYEQ